LRALPQIFDRQLEEVHGFKGIPFQDVEAEPLIAAEEEPSRPVNAVLESGRRPVQDLGIDLPAKSPRQIDGGFERIIESVRGVRLVRIEIEGDIDIAVASPVEERTMEVGEDDLRPVLEGRR
jgi:hypothetical protein